MSALWTRRLSQWASWPRIVALGVAVVVFNVGLLPHMAPLGLDFLPDTHFAYRPETLAHWLAAYSPAARQQTLWGHLTLDALYPCLYGSLLALLLARSWGPRFSGWWVWLPLAGVLCDYGENIVLAVLLGRWPAWSPTLAWVAGALTTAKWLFIFGTLGAILGGFLIRGLEALRQRA